MRHGDWKFLFNLNFQNLISSAFFYHSFVLCTPLCYGILSSSWHRWLEDPLLWLQPLTFPIILSNVPIRLCFHLLLKFLILSLSISILLFWASLLNQFGFPKQVVVNSNFFSFLFFGKPSPVQVSYFFLSAWLAIRPLSLSDTYLVYYIISHLQSAILLLEESFSKVTVLQEPFSFISRTSKDLLFPNHCYLHWTTCS